MTTEINKDLIKQHFREIIIDLNKYDNSQMDNII